MRHPKWNDGCGALIVAFVLGAALAVLAQWAWNRHWSHSVTVVNGTGEVLRRVCVTGNGVWVYWGEILPRQSATARIWPAAAGHFTFEYELGPKTEAHRGECGYYEPLLPMDHVMSIDAGGIKEGDARR